MYARLVATLDPCAPDLAPELMQQLKGEFRFRVSVITSFKYIPLHFVIFDNIRNGVCLNFNVFKGWSWFY